MIDERNLGLTRERLLAIESLSHDQQEIEGSEAVGESRRVAIRELLTEVLRLAEQLESSTEGDSSPPPSGHQGFWNS